MPEVDEQVVEAANDANGVASEAAEQTIPEASTEPKTPAEAAKEVAWKGELAARKARLKAKTDAFYRQQQEFERQKQEHLQQLQAREAARDKEIAELKEQLKGNPLLRAKPGEANELLKEFVQQGTPEAMIVRLEKQLQAQREEFERRWSEHSLQTQKQREEEAHRQQQAFIAQKESTARNLSLWVTGPEGIKTYKFLNAEHSQSEIHEQIMRLDAEVQAKNRAAGTNRQFSAQQVLEYLEKVAEKRYKSREDRAAGIFGGVSKQPAPGAAVSPPPKASPPAKGNGGAARQARQMTREEEEAYDLAELRKAQAADKLAAMPKAKKR